MITVFTLSDWVSIGIIGLAALFMSYAVVEYYFKKWFRRRK